MTSGGGLIITLDGPAGAGKSTVARALARRLGYRYLDTGAMYRALTLAALERGIPLDDAGNLTALTAASRLDLEPEPDRMRILLDGRDVTEEVREPRVNQAVSHVARIPGVRAQMVILQRAMAAGGGLVAEGRDMATVVFPGADLKIYLNATPGERARRRARDLEDAGHRVDVAELEREIARRDGMDSTRAVGPLALSAEHRVIETDRLSADQVVDAILRLVDGRGI